MRKVVSSLLILTLILLFAATYFNSRKTETVFAEQVDRINQAYPEVLKIELSDYQRGFLLSTATTTIQLQQKQFELSHQIRHLPWKMQIYSNLAEDSGLAVTQQLQTDVSLQGEVESRLAVPQLSFAADGSQLKLENLQLECRLQPGLSAGDISLRLTGLSLQERNDVLLLLNDLHLLSTVSDQQGLVIGNGEISLGRLQFQANQETFVVDGLRYVAANELQNEAVSGAVDFSLHKLQFAGEEFSQGRLQMKVSGLAAATLREMQQSARELQRQLASGQSDPLLFQLQLFGLYGQLFQPGLKLSIDQVALKTEQGRADGKGEFSLAQGEASGLMAFELLNGDFQLQFDQPFFSTGFRMFDRLQSRVVRNKAVLDEQAEQLAGGLVQKGILQRMAGGYQLDFAVRQGQPLLNGQALR